MIDPHFQYKKTENKEEAIARQRARRETQLERDWEIRHIVDKYGVVTPSIVCAIMGVNPLPQTAHERTQMRIIYRRLQRLSEHGKFRYHSEYTILAKHAKRNPGWKRRVRAGAVFYSSLGLAPHERHQFEHKALIAHARSTLELAFNFDTYRTDTQLRDDKERTIPLVYDFYGEVGNEAFAVECNRSDSPGEISRKCLEWQRHLSHFAETHFDITSYRYLWVMETERKAWNLRNQWVKDGLTSGHFLVTSADKFSPFIPSSILEPIWLWPKDDQLQSLRKNNVTESA